MYWQLLHCPLKVCIYLLLFCQRRSSFTYSMLCKNVCCPTLPFCISDPYIDPLVYCRTSYIWLDILYIRSVNKFLGQQMHIFSSKNPHLVVVDGLVCVRDPWNYAVGIRLLVGPPKPERLKGRGQTKCDSLVLQGRQLGLGLSTLSWKTTLLRQRQRRPTCHKA